MSGVYDLRSFDNEEDPGLRRGGWPPHETVGVCRSTRTLVWTLVMLAVALVLVPFVGMLPMGGWATGGGMMGSGVMDRMVGMHSVASSTC